MPKIHVLDKHTAELIAAGEVVERPASVAKELLENAIDAGATQITLSIRRGGIEQLQISDNGSGIESDSIENAFIRHATSKIAAAEDLAHIHTLGFRGEALASIASVARVELLTKSDADEFALCYRIAGGVPQGLEPGARGRGTTITVSDLFYNTPARMKFLKRTSAKATLSPTLSPMRRCPTRKYPSALCAKASSSSSPPATAACAAPRTPCLGASSPATCSTRRGRAARTKSPASSRRRAPAAVRAARSISTSTAAMSKTAR